MRFAILFTTYLWDEFVERQYRRVLATANGADVFVMADETRGPLPIKAEKLIRTSQEDLQQKLGLPLRIEEGLGKSEPLWWNVDYLTYRFFIENPQYDYCVTLDYDACLNVDPAKLVNEIRTRHIDLVAQPPYADKEGWYWEEPHLCTYSREEIEGRLLCIMIMSRRAAEMLLKRRRAMAAETTDFWPFCEVFVAVEMKRAGLKIENLSSFGSVDYFGYGPARWEGDYEDLQKYPFVHPILDTKRFLKKYISEHFALSDVARPRSQFSRQLRRLKILDVLPVLAREAKLRLPRRLRSS
jgi:hypothetical protein